MYENAGVPNKMVGTPRLQVFKRQNKILNTLWLFNIAVENCPFLDGLPINSMVIFHGYVSHNQMVKNDGKHWINGCPILRQIHRKKNGLLQGKHIRKPPYILHIS